jgi:hypothetical protein
VIGANNAEVNAPILPVNARGGFNVAWRNNESSWLPAPRAGLS